MTALLIAALTAAPAHALPTCPAQRAATKALRGDFGKLADWQRTGYTKLLTGGAERTLVLTAYWPGEGRDGQIDCTGRPLTPGAMASNKIPQGSYVFLPSWGRLFRIVDRGAKRNDNHRACRSSGGVWADVWLKRPSEARGRCNWTPTKAVVCR